MIATAAVISAAVCIMVCTHTQSQVTIRPTDLWQQQRFSRYQDSIYPELRRQVRSGQMITRLGSDVTSEVLRQLNLKDKSFSHCGVAVKEGDSIFVYHAIGGEFNPDQKLRRESLYSFCHPAENKAAGIFEMSLGSHATFALLDFAKGTFLRGVPFDMSFDYATDDRFYCAEFVAKCFTTAAGDSSWFTFSTLNGFRYVAVDDLFTSRRMRKVICLEY